MRLRIDIQLYFELITECPYLNDDTKLMTDFYDWLYEEWGATCTVPSDNDTDPLLGWELTFNNHRQAMLFEIKYANYYFSKIT